MLTVFFFLVLSACARQGSIPRGCPPIPTPIPTNERPPFEGQIAVTLSCGFGGGQEIYILNADGSGTLNLTYHRENDQEPDWSPDGTQITFASDRSGNYDIYTINIDGTGLTQLTDDPSDDRMPMWSPDGKRIMFVSTRNRSHKDEDIGEIYMMGSDGAGQQKLYQNELEGDPPVYNIWAAKSLGDWSPDSNQFAATYQGDIYIFSVDGSAPINISNHHSHDMKPQWSPDGHYILYLSNRYIEHGREIFVFNVDTNQTIRLKSLKDQRPRWSPDGSKILFTNRDTGNDDLYIVNVDGSGLTNLTNHQANDFRGEWSPNGKYISFFSGRDNNKLYVMNADGTLVTGFLLNVLTHSHNWSPTMNQG